MKLDIGDVEWQSDFYKDCDTTDLFGINTDNIDDRDKISNDTIKIKNSEQNPLKIFSYAIFSTIQS